MTGADDLGYTDLLDQQDVPIYDLRIEVLGTLDEVASTLGVARATTANARSETMILEIQHDLCWMMSELAATTEEARPDIHMTVERVNWLADMTARLRARIPAEFQCTVPGDSASGSFVQLARIIVRRAERLLTSLNHESTLHNPQIIPYLNHLSAFLFVLACYEDLKADSER